MSRHRTPQYRSGSHLVTCDISGRVDWAENFKTQWNGLIVHRDYFEERNPQDFTYAVRDQKPITMIRPQPATDTFDDNVDPNSL